MLTTKPSIHFFQDRPLTSKNTNMLWSGVIAETLYRKGLEYAVISPGSRSAPLTLGFAEHPKIECISVLDERSAGFFALGLAKQTNKPVTIIVTSGTAGANLYPALIEARMSQAPLIVITADRSPEMHHSQTRQTMDQQKLFGTYPQFYAELAMPELTENKLNYLRQIISHAHDRSIYPQLGPVHLNIPFDEPLAPTETPEIEAWNNQFNWNTFFNEVKPLPVVKTILESSQLLSSFKTQRGLILVGPTQPKNPSAFAKAIGHIANHLGWPVIADSINPLRHYQSDCPHLITQYDNIIRNKNLSNALKPDVILQVGQLPICKVLLHWLQNENIPTWIVESSSTNMDSLNQPSNTLHTCAETLAEMLPDTFTENSDYLNTWQQANRESSQAMDNFFRQEESFFEGKVAWMLSQYLPKSTPLFTTSSTPVRDMEWFWQPSDKQYQTYFNGGVNGIDGIVSTALGVAHNNKPSVLLTGDLSFLHDSNGLLIKNQFQGSLTIVLIDNNGGGIFEHLPISESSSFYEQFTATPQAVDIKKLASSFDILTFTPNTWDEFKTLIAKLPEQGIRIIYLKTSRKESAHKRKTLWKQLSQALN